MGSKKNKKRKKKKMAEKENALNGPMTKYSVILEDSVWQKINYWVQKAPGEISGLGKLVIEGGVFRIIDAILIDQENTGTSTDLDPAAVGKAMYEMRNTPGFLNFWWHSHVDMGVFWSGTDIDTIREIGQNGFVVSTVFNKRRELKTSIYFKEQEPMPELFIDDVPTTVFRSLDPALMEQWDAEYSQKCKSKTYPSYTGNWGPNWLSDWNKKNGRSDQMELPSTVSPDPDLEQREEEIKDFQWDIELMVRESEYDSAREYMHSILREIQDSSLTITEKVALRKETMDEFNKSRELFGQSPDGKGAIRVQQ